MTEIAGSNKESTVALFKSLNILVEALVESFSLISWLMYSSNELNSCCNFFNINPIVSIFKVALDFQN